MANRTPAANRTGKTAKKRPAPARSNRRGPAGDAAERTPARPRTARVAPVEEVETLPAPRAVTRTNRVTNKLKDAGTGLRTAGSAVGETIAEHAVPAALIGAGVAWLLMGSRVRGATRRAARAFEESDIMERAGEALGDVSDRFSGAAESVKGAFLAGVNSVGGTVTEAAGTLRNGASRLGEYAQEGARSVRDGASVVGEGARRGYSASREGVSQAWQRHPLTMGLAVLAAGVAAGMLLPDTQRENDMMGRQSDALSRRVRKAGETLAQRGKRVASSVAESVRVGAEGEGLGANDVVRRVRRIADHVQKATVSAARRERLDPMSVLKESEGGATDGR